ncbi:MAG: bifunctional DNA-formamidopyrimidine glycosylase/DNA-(apurinic or apyrimidinic site) lyase [Bryobacteraceae bacterium]
MPELPEVEAVCRKLQTEAAGVQIVRARILRPGIAPKDQAEIIEQELAGATLLKVERRGKNILMRLSGGRTLHVHLRMTGNLFVVSDHRFQSASVRLYLELAGGRAIVFEDQRALGRIALHTDEALAEAVSVLGPEPLSPEFTAESFVAAARKSRQPAKLYLMDQRRVAGLGNIYAAEALFLAGVDPRRAMNRIAPARLRELHGAILEVLRQAVRSAAEAYAEPGRFAEGESFPVAVYGREGEVCLRCGKTVRRIPQGGRSTYFCAGCQR